MPTLYHLFLRSAVVLCILGALTVSATAQDRKVELGEGREFYLGIPHCAKPPNEGARGVPLQLWIGSKVKNTVTIEAPAINFSKTQTIEPGKVRAIDIPEGLMNTEGEKVRPYGIRVKAAEPVTVTCYISYKVSGEAFKVTPLETLGKKYYALSLWQDRTDEYKPGQILIVATKDNTKVSYLPSADTERIKAGKWGSVTLQAGETFLIHSKVQPAYNQELKTDLSGTYIEATKPIAVFSGHTKGAFPRFSATMLGTPANFMRNMMVDQMPSVEFLGTEYISAPVQYTSRPYNNQDFDGQGDMFRFIAVEDNTDLYINRPDGSPKLIKKDLMKGQMYEVSNQLEPAYFTSTKPVVAGQYGKAWRLNVVTPSIGKKEQPQNPSRCGEGMMFALTPRSQWSSHCIFRSPEGMNNFCNITFESKNADSIYFDKKTLRAAFGNKVQEIPGTPYSYVATIIGAGEHTIAAHEEASSDVKFAAYVYGNFDATKDGFAYGYPAGVNYALNLPPDEIVIEDKQECGNVQGSVRVIHETDEYAGLYSIEMDKSVSFNYVFATNPNPIEPGSDAADYTLTVIDPMQDAKGVVHVIDRTGQVITREYEYIAERITAEPTRISFGPLAVGTEECRQVTLTNPTDADVQVKNLKTKLGLQEFTIKAPAFPFTIKAGESVTIEVCGKAYASGERMDSIQAELSCYNPMLAEVRLKSGEPKVTMTDWNFGAVPVGVERMKEIVITNVSEGDVTVQLDAVDWADKTHFRTEGLLDKLPIILTKSGEEFKFTVYYKPSEAGVQNETSAQFTGNTTVIKTHSDWKGIGIESGPYIFGNDWLKRRVNPATPYPFENGGFGIAGNTSFKVERIEITGADAAAFTFDEARFNKDYAGQTLNAGFEVGDLGYTFNPTDERPYEATITIHGKDAAGNDASASAQLLGEGIQPHVEKTDIPFGIILVNTTKDGVAIIRSTGSDVLTLSNLRIVDHPTGQAGDAQYFEFQAGFDPMMERRLNPGEELEVPVTFKPTVVRNTPTGFTAQIEFDHDAPEQVYPQLTGGSNDVGTPDATAEGYTFNPIYVFTNSDEDTFNGTKQYGRITVRNTGDVDGTITNWEILQTTGTDYNNFTAPAVAPILLPAGNEPAYINGFVFTYPTADRAYSATVRIDVEFENGSTKTLEAVLNASAKYLPVTVDIPNGYRINASEVIDIDFTIKNDGAAEPLTRAKIDKFHASVDYKREVLRAGANKELTADDFILDRNQGTLLDAADGWRVVNPHRVSLGDGWEQLQVELVNDNGTAPIVLDGTDEKPLFKFKARGYLASEQYTDLKSNMLLISRDFVVISKLDGDLTINEVCVNDGRAIQMTNTFGLSSVAPNPVKEQTEITYSVAFDAPTRIVVVNSLGEEVAVLVDGVQEAGTYSIPFNVGNLAAGTYFYRMTSGPFSDTKVMNVVK